MNLLQKGVFFQMFWIFFFLEILLIIAIDITYYVQLDSTRSKVKSIIEENNMEVLNSFNTFMENRVNKIRLDLLLIANHIKWSISNNENTTENCLVSDTDIDNIINEGDYPIDSENPIQLLIRKRKYFSPQTKTEEEIIQDLFTLKYLDKISYYNETNNPNKNSSLLYEQIDKKFMCSLKSILKTILIKNIISEKAKLYLNSFFIFKNDVFFKYPISKITLDTLKSIPEYNVTISHCKYYYSPDCFTNFFNGCISNLFYNTNHLQFFHYLDPKIYSLSCVKLNYPIIDENINTQSNAKNIFNPLNDFICIQNNLTFVSVNVSHQALNKTEITSITVFGDESQEIRIFFTMYRNISLFPKVFNLDILQEFKFNQYPLLFHLIYYDIFFYKNDTVSEKLMDDLRKEFNVIKTNILNALKELSLNTTKKSVSFTVKQTFIDAVYNISGKLDYCKLI